MSIFITFEGGEGSGKSYQSKRLYQRLINAGYNAILTQEPGGTPIGDEITRLLKWPPKNKPSALTELFLFNASRAELVNTVIQPAIRNGKIVVCDRFTDSTVVYQGYGLGLDIEMIKILNKFATSDLKPDITFLLLCPPEKGLKRKQKQPKDRFEQEDIGFHQKLYESYMELTAIDSNRWVTIDATMLPEDIESIIWQKICSLLKQGKTDK
jgi:dTMP kinase